jgi:Flp pilus assembly protein TadG
MAAGMTRRRTRTNRDRGSELIELAIVMPIFLVIICAIVDFAFLFQRWEVVTNATREGARLSTLLSPYQIPNDVTLRVQAYLNAGGLSGAPTVTVTDTTQTLGTGTVKMRRVHVLYPTSFIFIPYNINLQSVSEMRIEGGS